MWATGHEALRRRLQVLGLNLRSSAFLSLLPWVVMAVGSTSAGLLADGLVRRGLPIATVRKVGPPLQFASSRDAECRTCHAQMSVRPRAATCAGCTDYTDVAKALVRGTPTASCSAPTPTQIAKPASTSETAHGLQPLSLIQPHSLEWAQQRQRSWAAFVQRA